VKLAAFDKTRTKAGPFDPQFKQCIPSLLAADRTKKAAAHVAEPVWVDELVAVALQAQCSVSDRIWLS
jgi:hypothetical protein